MRTIITVVAAVGTIALAAVVGFAYVLYKVGEQMHMFRCGAAGQDRGKI